MKVAVDQLDASRGSGNQTRKLARRVTKNQQMGCRRWTALPLL